MTDKLQKQDIKNFKNEKYYFGFLNVLYLTKKARTLLRLGF
jgi:predicted DNA binding CopG/RHH family protein